MPTCLTFRALECSAQVLPGRKGYDTRGKSPCEERIAGYLSFREPDDPADNRQVPFDDRPRRGRITLPEGRALFGVGKEESDGARGERGQTSSPRATIISIRVTDTDSG